MSASTLPRLLRLLELLGRGRVTPGPELAATLGVDDRTLRRDVERLRDLGYEVETERGRFGGYRLARQAVLPPVVLDQQDAAVLVIGIEAAFRAGLRVHNAQQLAQRVMQLLPTDVAAAVDTVRQVLDLDAPPTRNLLSTSGLLAVAAAVHEARALDLRYTDAKGRSTERLVDPWALVHHGQRWYLVGHDRLRDDVRTLRVDRLDALLPAGPRAHDPPTGFDPAAHVADLVTSKAWRHEVEVAFDAPVDIVRRRLPASIVNITEDDDTTVLRTGADDLRGMACLLAGTGLPCTVRTPTALADELTALGQSLIADQDR